MNPYPPLIPKVENPKTLHTELLKRFVKVALDAFVLFSITFVPPFLFHYIRKLKLQLLQGILPNVR